MRRAVLLSLALVLLSACSSPSWGGADSGNGDTSTDGGANDAGPQWCGNVERDCGGGSCDAGICAPVVLYRDAFRPCSVAVDDTGIYFTDTRVPEDPTARIVRLPHDGGSAVEIVTGLIGPLGLAIDGNSVVWTSYRMDGGVFRVSKGGGEVEVLASNQRQPRRLAFAGQDVVWVNRYGGEVNRWSSGQITNLIPNARSPSDVEVIGGYAFVASMGNRTLLRVDLGNGGTESIASWSCDKVTGCVVEIAADERGVASAVEQRNEEQGEVSWLPHDGGVSARMATGQRGPADIVIGDGFLFWVNRGTGPNSYLDGQVMRKALDGGVIQVVADNQPLPCGIALWRGRVYWTSAYAGQVMMKDFRGE